MTNAPWVQWNKPEPTITMSRRLDRDYRERVYGRPRVSNRQYSSRRRKARNPIYESVFALILVLTALAVVSL